MLRRMFNVEEVKALNGRKRIKSNPIPLWSLLALLTDKTWIGLTDMADEGTFTWEDGTELTYTR